MSLAGVDLVAFVSTADAARAERFYGQILELPLVSRTPFALVFDAHGTTLRVAIVDRVLPAPYTVLGWVVVDIVRAVERLSSRGVEFLGYDGLTQDERGIWISPGGARIAWFRDPDGNVLSLTQR
jgi:catechol 2,3-dioxygenase-like lactoylglutathione lyase family enzyme